MKILELFSGTASFSNVCNEKGHEVFTVDIEKGFNPDLCIDILDFKKEMLPKEFRNLDVIWASPPCNTFSVASIYRHWKEGKPKSDACLRGIEIVKKTIEIIKELKPKYFIIENPRGMLRKQDFMQQFHRDTVTYCQYGAQQQKATDLWNNLNHKFKPMCSPRAPCHIRAPRGSSFGIQGIKARKGFHPDSRYVISRSSIQRAIVPRELCLEIIKYIEQNEVNESKMDELKIMCVKCGSVKPISNMKGGYKNPQCKTCIKHKKNKCRCGRMKMDWAKRCRICYTKGK